MDLGRAILGLKAYAIPSVVVGLATLGTFLYAAMISPDADSEGMQSLAKTAVIVGALAQVILVVVLLIPGTAPLRRKSSRGLVSGGGESQRADPSLVAQIMIWFALGESGGIFVFLSALLATFTTSVFDGGSLTIFLIVGGFAAYAACFVFLIILPLARSNAFKPPSRPSA